MHVLCDVGVLAADRHNFLTEDLCRVCREGALPNQPLYHPCKCTGSIRAVHHEWFVLLALRSLAFIHDDYDQQPDCLARTQP